MDDKTNIKQLKEMVKTFCEERIIMQRILLLGLSRKHLSSLNIFVSNQKRKSMIFLRIKSKKEKFPRSLLMSSSLF